MRRFRKVAFRRIRHGLSRRQYTSVAGTTDTDRITGCTTVRRSTSPAACEDTILSYKSTLSDSEVAYLRL